MKRLEFPVWGKELEVATEFNRETSRKRGAIATVGQFDGLHRGHMLLLERLVEEGKKRDLRPLAFTFSNHPLDVLNPRIAPKALMEAARKRRMMESVGVECIMEEFTPATARLTALEWMRRLRDERGVEVFLLGYDNRFGSDCRTLNHEDYRRLAESLGMECLEGECLPGCSSSSARRAISEGRMEEASRILGRPYAIEGKVEEGNRLGRRIGFPTANLSLDPGRQLPPPGVFEARVRIEGIEGEFRAAVNIGLRPSIEASLRREEPILEAHILDFSGDIYGKGMRVELLRMLRGERKFPSLEALSRQLQEDIEGIRSGGN